MGKRNKNKQFKELTSKDKSHYCNDGRNYSNRNYNNRFGKSKFYRYDQYYHSFHHKRGKNFLKKESNNRYPSRPQSPVLGTPEYMEKKIEETSAIIMKHLLNPNEPPPINIPTQSKNDETIPSDKFQNQELPKSVDSSVVINNKNKKKLSSQEVEEIHSRIMCHLTNLNDGRKRNLINSHNSGYDMTIQHFVKQQRLEISRALRTMCSETNIEEPNEIINSIIPDIGIKIEKLPKNIIEELSKTFGCDFNVDMEKYSNFTNNTSEVLQFDQISMHSENSFIGQEMSGEIFEPIWSSDEKFKKEVSQLSSNIDRENNCQIKTEDDDVVLINNSSEVIEINDDDDDVVKKNEDIKNVTIMDVKPPLKILDLIVSENVSTVDYDEVDNGGFDDINKKEEFNKVDKKEISDELDNKNFGETVKTEFEAIETGVLKKEDEETVDNDNRNIELNNASEDLKPVTDVKEEECEIISKQMEAQSVKQIIQKQTCRTQTELYEDAWTIDLLLKRHFRTKPTNLREAVDRMTLIDQWVSKLTRYRQDMLRNFTSDATNISGGKKNYDDDRKKVKRKRIISDELDSSDNEERSKEMNEIEEITFEDIDDSSTKEKLMKFDKVDDVISVIRIFEDKLVAASESGKIYICSLNDGKFLQVLPLQSGVPILSLVLVKEGLCSTNIYIGTFRDYLHVYNFESYQYLRSITVEESVQCMDTKWGYIFIGCIGGWLQRYSIERESMEYEEKFNEGTILTLKATVEGPRRILLVASEESTVCIRDAMTGLRLRTIDKYDTYNVHSLIVDRNLIYCGTCKGELLILSFHKGTMIQTAKIPGASGKVCMKHYRNILFISRDKDVHLYDLKTNKFIGEIKGPGGDILSLEIAKNQLILGTNARNFIAIHIDWSLFKNR